MKVSAAKLVTMLATSLAGFALVCWPARPQSQDDPGWTDKHFMAAFDEFFPIEHAEGDFIAVRAHRDSANDVPEFSVVLENTQTPGQSAEFFAKPKARRSTSSLGRSTPRIRPDPTTSSSRI